MDDEITPENLENDMQCTYKKCNKWHRYIGYITH